MKLEVLVTGVISQEDGNFKNYLGYLDLENKCQYFQLLESYDSIWDSEIKGIVVNGKYVYVLKKFSLCIYSFIKEESDKKNWFNYIETIELPEWKLSPCLQSVGNNSILFAEKGSFVYVANNSLGCIYKFNRNMKLVDKIPIWDFFQESTYIDDFQLNKSENPYGVIRSLIQDDDGDILCIIMNKSLRVFHIVNVSTKLLIETTDFPLNAICSYGEYLACLNSKNNIIQLIPRVKSDFKSKKKLYGQEQCEVLKGLNVNKGGLYSLNIRNMSNCSEHYLVCFDGGGSKVPKVLMKIYTQNDLSKLQIQDFTFLAEKTELNYLEKNSHQILLKIPNQSVKKLKDENTYVSSVFKTEQNKSIVQNEEKKILIDVQNVSLYYERVQNKKIKIFALKNISLQIEKGDVIGIVGRNGAGKSSLSKLICGILLPDAGRVIRFGKAQLLSLGVGFKKDLSGFDNIIINGTILGLTRKQISDYINEIIEFAELKDFINEPVRTYSAGMKSRLSFAIATMVRPDILVLDEVLSTGDNFFKRKAEARMKKLKNQASCVVMVSHSLSQLENVCNRIIWLEKGELMMSGDVDTVIEQYKEFCKSPSNWLKKNEI